MSSFDKRTHNARAKAVELKVAEMYRNYLENNFMVPPETLCEDRKSYRGIVIRYFDPPFGTEVTDNTVLVEEYVGDSWTLRFERRQK